MTFSASPIRLSSTTPVLLPAEAWSRLGLITLSTDLTTERDYRSLIPAEGLGLYTTRVAFKNPTTPENLKQMLPKLTSAAALLPDDQPFAAICYSCTAASVVIGDAAITKAIQQTFPGVPVVTPSLSAVQALSVLGARKISVLTPYLMETSEPMAAYFTNHGLNIQRFHCLGMDDDREMARVSANSIIEAACAADHSESEAVFISCTGLPAVNVIDVIEQEIGKPVVTSNQATAWAMLNHAHCSKFPTNFGQLYRKSLTD